MTITLDYPTETQQMKIVAQQNNLNNLKVYIPEEDDWEFEDNTMIVFSNTNHSTFQNVLDFSKRVGHLFRRNVYVSAEHETLDNTQIMKALQYAEEI